MLPVANPNVIFRSLAEGAVLFSTSDEVYFGLNDVGARVWELLPPTLQTFDELCSAIQERYPDIDAATIRADVGELLNRFAEYGLVLPRGLEAPDAPDKAAVVAQAGQTQRR